MLQVFLDRVALIILLIFFAVVNSANAVVESFSGSAEIITSLTISVNTSGIDFGRISKEANNLGASITVSPDGSASTSVNLNGLYAGSSSAASVSVSGEQGETVQYYTEAEGGSNGFTISGMRCKVSASENDCEGIGSAQTSTLDTGSITIDIGAKLTIDASSNNLGTKGQKSLPNITINVEYL